MMLKLKPQNSVVISLVSQNHHEVRIEVIHDEDVKQLGRNHFKTASFTHKLKHLTETIELKESVLQHFVTLSHREELMTESEVGWISNTKLILTVNNEFFLVNIDST